jgi:hypothetical protein
MLRHAAEKNELSFGLRFVFVPGNGNMAFHFSLWRRLIFVGSANWRKFERVWPYVSPLEN